MIAIASDHGGFDLKEEVKKHLEERGLEYKDFGTYDKNSCDYPDFGVQAAKAVGAGECEKGIVICTTGIGISIVANKVKGVRCALCSAEWLDLSLDARLLILSLIQSFQILRSTAAELPRLLRLKRTTDR